MKLYKNILSFCLAVILGASLFTGCAKVEMINGEEEGAAEKPLLTVMTSVSETAVTRVDDPLADDQNINGSWIKDMTIFLFEPSASDDSRPLLVKTAKAKGMITKTNQIRLVELTKKELGDANVVGTQVDIYAIANHIPVEAALLTKKEVMKLTATTPTYRITEGAYHFIPMSGIALGHAITSEVNQQTDISLQRTILRVKVTVVDAEFDQDKYAWSLTTIKLYNDYSATYLWNKGIPGTPTLRDEGQAFVKNMLTAEDGVNGKPIENEYLLGTFYLSGNEPSDANPSPTNKITVKLIGSRTYDGIETPFEYTIGLKRSDDTYNFERNTALNVTITLKNKGHETNVEVVPWNVVTETPDIDPVGIRFVDTDMPTVIPKDGILTAKFNFDNPAAIPFKLYMFEGDTHTGTQLNELEPIASQQQVLITALAEKQSGVRSVSFWYKYDDIWVDTGVRAVQGETNAIIQPKANTYLVAPSSASILIPVAQANDAAVPGINFGEVLTAELVWTDVKGATSGRGLADDAAVAAIEVIGSGPEATLMVTPGSQLGNAVIAVKNAAGVIKWSWNIWVTDYNPEQEIGQNTSGGYIFMDRNLGAKSIVPNVNGVDIAGNYYQYGRKDPFPTKGSGKAFVAAYNAAGTVVVNQFDATSSIEKQIRNPYTWGGYSAYPTGMKLWGEGGSKTVNDPCPAGWRVPPSDAYVDITDALMPVDAAVAGRQGAYTGYYPYTWMVNGNEGKFWDLKLVANWTSTASASGSTAWMLRGDLKGTIHPKYNWYVNFGNAVRCVRDWENKKFEKEVRVLTAGMISVSKSHYLGSSHNPLYGTTWQEGLVPLLSTNFGPGKPVDVFFKHYNYSNGGHNQEALDYNFINLLKTKEIDVLYLPWNGVGSPTPAQAQEILNWLDADSRRVLLVGIDYSEPLKHMQKALGITKTPTYGDNAAGKLTGRIDSDIYNTLVTTGKYGNVTNQNFLGTYDWTYFDKDELMGHGYVPILERQANSNHITMAVNPQKRVVVFSDSAFFYGPSVLNLDGSLKASPKGDYPILMANMWAWIVETVKTK